MRIAENKNGFIGNFSKHNPDKDIPDGWFDFTGIIGNRGDPVVNGVPVPRPSKWHRLSGIDWIVTSEDQILKDSEDSETQRIYEIVQEQELSGFKKKSVGWAHNKIDTIFEGATTVALLRIACVKVFKILVTFILK